MAIIGPADLPVVLKLNSDPIKKHVLTKLGYPVVAVELEESQLEVIIRTAGDWISGYFPREQKLAVFYTQPLRSTYPLPTDAYWIQECNWDPVTTRIDDVFGAESFLFCVAPSFKVLAKDGSLQPLCDWKKHWFAKTPYGNSKLAIKKHNNDRPLPKIRLTYDGGFIEATANHVLALPPGPPVAQKWREFSEVSVGDQLCGVNAVTPVISIDVFQSCDAVTPRAIGSGCYYGCVDGEPVLMH